MAKIKVIGSGSSGNGYIVKCKDESLVIELGMGFKGYNDEDFEHIRGCIVSHRHTDHLNANTVNRMTKYGIPVYSCEDVCSFYPSVSLVRTGEKKRIGCFSVQPIPLEHSVENYGYLIEHKEFGRMVFATDTSSFNYNMRGINHWIIEANYSADIVIDHSICDEKTRSQFSQHLSIEQCCETVKRNYFSGIQSVILIHLSDGNSDERKFVERMKREIGFSNVFCAVNGVEIELLKEEF